MVVTLRSVISSVDAGDDGWATVVGLIALHVPNAADSDRLYADLRAFGLQFWRTSTVEPCPFRCNDRP
jgi:hypothetical protein